MPSMPYAWRCEASAMKLFLLLGLVSFTTVVDAEVSPNSVVEKKEDATDTTATVEPQFFSTQGTTAAEVTSTAEGTKTAEVSTTDITSTSNRESSTSPAGVTPADVPPFDQERKTDIEKINYDDEFFYYDYYSLRKWGLVAAAILFILGILILTCGKHGKFPRCRGKKRGRTYDVTRA